MLDYDPCVPVPFMRELCTSAFYGKREVRKWLGRSQGLSSEHPIVLSPRLERQPPLCQSLGFVMDGWHSVLRVLV